MHSSALFLTAAAQNLLCMKLASELGVVIASPWVTWFTAALVPALVGLTVTPLIMYKARPLNLVYLLRVTGLGCVTEVPDALHTGEG